MTWGAVGAAAIGVGGTALMSSMGGGGGGGGSVSTKPWGSQQGYLKYGFEQAKPALRNAQEMGTFKGDRVADLHNWQKQGASGLADFATKQGTPGAQNLFNTGSTLMNAGAQFGSNAQSIYNQSGVDPTQQILSNANKYANNPHLDGVIDAANRDVVRGLNEQQLPSLARASTASGNTNSTRAGVESAILQRGAADRMADTASSIRSQFFGKGLDMSQEQYNQGIANKLNANGQLQSAFGSGQGALLGSQQMAGNNFDFLNQAGGVYQNQNQREIDGQIAAFKDKQNTRLDLVGKYMGTIGGGFGSSTSTSSSANPLGAGLGLATAGLGLYGKMGGFTPSTSPAAQTPVYSGSMGMGGWGDSVGDYGE